MMKRKVLKPKVKFRPQTTPEHPRTNSTNPLSMSKLEDAYRGLVKAQDVPVGSKQGKPTKRMPSISEKYIRMGEGLKMCPYEIQAIMEHQFDANNVLVRETLKKFLAAMKLSGEVDLAPTRKMLRDVEIKHQDNLRMWEDHCESVDKMNVNREATIKQMEADFAQAWGAIIIDLVQKVDKNPDIESLGGVDKWMVQAIAETDKQAAQVDSNGRVALNFTALKKISPDKISTIPGRARELKEDFEELEHVKWLCKASILELTKEMQLATDPKLCELYGNVLMFRKGLRSMPDGMGGYHWIKANEVQAIADKILYDEDGESERRRRWARSNQRDYEIEVLRMVKYSNDDLIHYAYRNYCHDKKHPF